MTTGWPAPAHGRKAPEGRMAARTDRHLDGMAGREVADRRSGVGTVSGAARTLETAVAAFHQCPVRNICPVLMPDGWKEITDHRRTAPESAARRELFPGGPGAAASKARRRR